MKDKTAGVVTLFYPSKDLLKNINTYINHIDKLYIVSNSPLYYIFSSSKIRILHNGENIGIAKAYNLALKEAMKNGYEFLLTMDQDSYFEKEQIENYFECIQKNDNKDIVIFSPSHVVKKVKNCKYLINKIFMSSGNIIKVDKIINVGGFDENLFIDEVDHEICMRVIKNKHKTVQFNNIYLNHNLGKLIYINNKKIRLYSPNRIYYILRNFLYLRNKYYKDFQNFFETRDKFIRKFLYNQLKYNNKKFLYVKNIVKAFIDYKKGKYGKQIELD